jgi:hypothetical protein
MEMFFNTMEASFKGVASIEATEAIASVKTNLN